MGELHIRKGTRYTIILLTGLSECFVGYGITESDSARRQRWNTHINQSLKNNHWTRQERQDELSTWNQFCTYRMMRVLRFPYLRISAQIEMVTFGLCDLKRQVGNMWFHDICLGGISVNDMQPGSVHTSNHSYRWLLYIQCGYPQCILHGNSGVCKTRALRFPLGPGDTQSPTEHAWIDGQNSRPQAASNDLRYLH